MSLAATFASLLHDPEDVFLADDQMLFAVQVHFAAGVLPEQHLVALLHVEGPDLAVLAGFAGARRDDDALLRLLLGGVGDDDPTLGLLLLLDALHEDAVLERTDLHFREPPSPS